MTDTGLRSLKCPCGQQMFNPREMVDHMFETGCGLSEKARADDSQALRAELVEQLALLQIHPDPTQISEPVKE